MLPGCAHSSFVINAGHYLPLLIIIWHELPFIVVSIVQNVLSAVSPGDRCVVFKMSTHFQAPAHLRAVPRNQLPVCCILCCRSVISSVKISSWNPQRPQWYIIICLGTIFSGGGTRIRCPVSINAGRTECCRESELFDSQLFKKKAFKSIFALTFRGTVS